MGPSLSPKVNPLKDKKGAGTPWLSSMKTENKYIKYVLKGKQLFILPTISKHVKLFNNNRP
jgi:hypothetical protein